MGGISISSCDRLAGRGATHGTAGQFFVLFFPGERQPVVDGIAGVAR